MAVREWLTGRHSHHNRLVLVLENLRERKLVSRAVKWANLSENIAAGKGCGYAPVLHQLHVGKCISGFDGEDGRAVERALADGRAQERGDGNAVQHGHGGVCRMSRGCELTYGTVKAKQSSPLRRSPLVPCATFSHLMSWQSTFVGLLWPRKVNRNLEGDCIRQWGAESDPPPSSQAPKLQRLPAAFGVGSPKSNPPIMHRCNHVEAPR
jgi:hypothetical protein